MRRNRKQLETEVEKAKNRKEKALGFYKLGLFHDNNGREKEAIPNYLNALRLGLSAVTRAKSLAWLASSLDKTGKPTGGLRRCKEALQIAKDRKLRRFLIGLERRISKAI